MQTLKYVNKLDVSDNKTWALKIVQTNLRIAVYSGNDPRGEDNGTDQLLSKHSSGIASI